MKTNENLVFNTMEEAKEYASLNLSKRESKKAYVKDQSVILCGTCLVFEDVIWNDSLDLFCTASNIFGLCPSDQDEDCDDTMTYGASRLRDSVIELIEELYECKIIIGNDTY